MKTPLKAAIFPGVEQMAASGGQFERVWTLHLMNMDPNTTDRLLRGVNEEMARLGYHPEREPLRFGGEQGLTYLCVFRRTVR